MLGGEQRRRATPNKYRTQRMATGPGGKGRQFPDKPINECCLTVLRVHNAVEIAVVALVEAKRNVDVEPLDRVIGNRANLPCGCED